MIVRELVTLLKYQVAGQAELNKYNNVQSASFKKNKALLDRFGNEIKTSYQRNTKESNRENDKRYQYELTVRYRLARLKERLEAQDTLRKQREATRQQRINERALEYELRARIKLNQQKERLERQERARQERETARKRRADEAEQKLQLQRAGQLAIAQGFVVGGLTGREILKDARTAGDIEASKNVLRGLTLASNPEMAKLTKVMQSLSLRQGISPLETLGGMTELGRAGFKASEIGTMVPSISKFGKNSQTTFDQASTMVTDAMFTFGKSTKDIPEITDSLTAALNETKLGFEDLSFYMKYAASSGKASGNDLKDVLFIGGLLAQAGFRGETGGTGARTIFTNAAALGKSPFGKRRQRMTLSKLGVNAWTPDDRLDLPAVFAQLGDKLKGKSRAEKLDVFNALFGRTAQNQALALMELMVNQPKEVARIQKGIFDSFDQTNKTFNIMNQGYNVEINKMKNSIELLRSEIGEQFTPVLSNVANKLQFFTEKIINATPGTKKFFAILIAGFAGLSAWAGLYTLVKITASLTGIQAVLGTIAASFTSPIFLWLVGLTTIGLVLEDIYQYLKGNNSVTGLLIDNLKKYFDKFKDYLSNVWIQIKERFHNMLADLKQAFIEFFTKTLPDAVKNLGSSLIPDSIENLISKLSGGSISTHGPNIPQSVKTMSNTSNKSVISIGDINVSVKNTNASAKEIADQTVLTLYSEFNGAVRNKPKQLPTAGKR